MPHFVVKKTKSGERYFIYKKVRIYLDPEYTATEIDVTLGELDKAFNSLKPKKIKVKTAHKVAMAVDHPISQTHRIPKVIPGRYKPKGLQAAYNEKNKGLKKKPVAKGLSARDKADVQLGIPVTAEYLQPGHLAKLQDQYEKDRAQQHFDFEDKKGKIENELNHLEAANGAYNDLKAERDRLELELENQQKLANEHEFDLDLARKERDLAVAESKESAKKIPVGIKASAKQQPIVFGGPSSTASSTVLPQGSPVLGTHQSSLDLSLFGGPSVNYREVGYDPRRAEAKRLGAAAAAASAGSQSGSGLKGGMYDDQIQRGMHKYPEFKGVIARDQIASKIMPHIHAGDKVGFIMNTDIASKPGQHWLAVYADATPHGSHSIEYYNPLADHLPPDIRADLKRIADKLAPHAMLKLKINQVKQQSNNSNNCGEFAMRFLMDRFNGKPFSEATGWDDGLRHHAVMKNEAEIARLKRMPPFSHL